MARGRAGRKAPAGPVPGAGGALGGAHSVGVTVLPGVPLPDWAEPTPVPSAVEYPPSDLQVPAPGAVQTGATDPAGLGAQQRGTDVPTDVDPVALAAAFAMITGQPASAETVSRAPYSAPAPYAPAPYAPPPVPVPAYPAAQTQAWDSDGASRTPPAPMAPTAGPMRIPDELTAALSASGVGAASASDPGPRPDAVPQYQGGFAPDTGPAGHGWAHQSVADPRLSTPPPIAPVIPGFYEPGINQPPAGQLAGGTPLLATGLLEADEWASPGQAGVVAPIPVQAASEQLGRAYPGHGYRSPGPASAGNGGWVSEEEMQAQGLPAPTAQVVGVGPAAPAGPEVPVGAAQPFAPSVPAGGPGVPAEPSADSGLTPEQYQLAQQYALMIGAGQVPGSSPGSQAGQPGNPMAEAPAASPPGAPPDPKKRHVGRPIKFVAAGVAVLAVAGAAFWGASQLLGTPADAQATTAGTLTLPPTIGDYQQVSGTPAEKALNQQVGLGVRPAGVTTTAAYGAQPAGPVELSVMATQLPGPTAAAQFKVFQQRTGADVGKPVAGTGTTAGISCAAVTASKSVPKGSLCVWDNATMRGQVFVVDASPTKAAAATAEVIASISGSDAPAT